MPTTKRKIRFYCYKFFQNDRSNNRVEVIDPIPIFSHINGLPFTIGDGRYLPYGSKSLTMVVDNTRPQIRGRIGIRRVDTWPTQERAGSEQPITAPPDTALLESTHFVFFPSNIMGIEFNFFGPRATTLTTYLPAKSGGIINEMELQMIVNEDARQIIQRVGDVSLARLVVRRDAGEQLQHIDRSLSDALNGLTHFSSNAETYEIIIRKARRDGGLRMIGGKIQLANWIMNEDNKAVTDKLLLRGKNTQSGKIDNFDLLGDGFIFEVKVDRVDSKHSTVVSDSMYRKIIETYNANQAALERISTTLV